MEIEKMHPGQKAQLRASALRVRKLYPGVAGEILAQYLIDWEEFGYRFDVRGEAQQLVKLIWNTKLPEENAPPKMGWEEI